MKYYYVSPLDLKPGDIIKKGRFGFMTKRELRKRKIDYTNFKNCNKLILQKNLDKDKYAKTLFYECIFEKVRREKFKDKVSRWNCVYLCKDISSARKFRNKYRKGGYIYKVETIANKSKKFEGDFRIITYAYPQTRLYIKKCRDRLKLENINVRILPNGNLVYNRKGIDKKTGDIIQGTLYQISVECAAEEYWSGIKTKNAMIEVIIEDDLKVISK